MQLMHRKYKESKECIKSNRDTYKYKKERREHLRGNKCKDWMVDLEEMYAKNKVRAHGEATITLLQSRFECMLGWIRGLFSYFGRMQMVTPSSS